MSNFKLQNFKTRVKPHASTRLSQIKFPTIEARLHQEDYNLRHKPKSNNTSEPKHRVRSRYKSPFKHTHSMHSQVNLSQLPDTNTSNGFPDNVGESKQNAVQRKQLFNNEYYNSSGENQQTKAVKSKELLKMQRKKRRSIASKNPTDQSQIHAKQQTGKETEGKGKRLSIENIKKGCSKSRNLSQFTNHLNKAIQENFSTAFLPKGQHLEPKVSNNPQTSFENKLQKKVAQLKEKLSRRKLNDEGKSLTREGLSQNVNQSLFDTIHSYLANPQRSFSKHKSTNIKAALQQKRHHLLTQLSNLEKKQESNNSCHREVHNPMDNNKSNAGESTENEYDWRRIELLSEKDRSKVVLSVDESNFEREVNHLSNLQQRNESSLQRYMEHQRMLLDLKLIKSHSLKQNLKNSHSK